MTTTSEETTEALPANWRSASSVELQNWLDWIVNDEDDREEIFEELQLRRECRADSRLAQALGCSFGEEPS